MVQGRRINEDVAQAVRRMRTLLHKTHREIGDCGVLPDLRAYDVLDEAFLYSDRKLGQNRYDKSLQVKKEIPSRARCSSEAILDPERS